MRPYTIAGAALLTFALAAPVTAQERPFGVTIGYPGSIGMLWQVGERVALRPEFTIGYSNEGYAEIGVETAGWRFGIATSAVLSIYRDGPRHLYLVPYYEYRRRNTTLFQRISYSTDAPGDIGANFLDLELDTRRTEHTFGGLIGIEFRMTDRSAVFAEAGPAWRNSIQRAPPIPELPLRHSPLPFSDESLNATDGRMRAVARVGVNLRF